MFKSVAFHGTLNERTGYGIHASRFTEQLSKLIPVNVNGEGDVHVSLLDVVTAAHTTVRHPAPSILYSVWESTSYPDEFMDKLKLYDALWVPSEAQKAWSVAQGIPEEFVKVVPEGVDPITFHPVHVIDPSETFDFVHTGQWQSRKSTKEICESFLKAFPRNKRVRLYLSADTLFPSDEYKSTEERLKAYGLEDPRIIPVHFEERDAYIRRLQTANCFASCSRSEGWGLPIIEAMACGIPAIVADFGGSTEYAGDALNVRIRELRKPHGIFGNWDVPGQWAEPDYDHLVELMKDAYKNYATHKEKALVTAEKIRTKFSWAEAAKKAYAVLEELSLKSVSAPVIQETVQDPETSIRTHARSLGYEITAMKKRKAIFTVDTHPDSKIKMDTLIETIKQIKGFGYPVLVSSHLALSPDVVELTDFYIYDKRDILSGDDKPIYWRVFPDGTKETTKASIPCHALAACMNIRNSVDFCLGKYDWIYHISSDTEIDLGEWLAKVHASDKSMICLKWENQENTVSGQITASTTDIADKTTPKVETWAEFAAMYGEHRFCAEEKYYKDIVAYVGLENIEFITMDVANRFDQVDRDAWKDDMFECHFVEGPFMNIVGISDREYDVTYSNSVDGSAYALKQKPGMWSRPSAKFYRDWEVKATLGGVTKFQHKLDLAGKNIIISMGSKALGDTIAWIPYVDEFRKKHNCTVYCSTWWNGIMDYPEIRFITPGDAVENVYATYEVGCHDNQPDKNPIDWRIVPLQKVAADILGLDYEPIRPKLKYVKHKRGNGKEPKHYICFSEYSTMQNKMWNREGAWQKVIDHLNKLDYDCVSISVEPTKLEGVIKHNGQSVEQTLTDLSGAEFYVGLNHGPVWLAYALDIPVIMLSGVSEPFNDFPMFARIQIDDCRPGCFNDPSLPIDRGWAWCPRNKDFVCTRNITESMVIKQITRLRKELPCPLPLKRKAASTRSVPPTQSTQKGQPSKKPRAKRDSLMLSSIQTGVQAGATV